MSTRQKLIPPRRFEDAQQEIVVLYIFFYIEKIIIEKC